MATGNTRACQLGMFLIVSLVGEFSSASSQPRKSGNGVWDATLNCSLNGDVVAGGGGCHCDAAWSGSPDCDVLAIEDVPADTEGYHNATAASWGGNVIYEATTSTYHLFVAQMTGGCGLEHWGSNSAIIRAVGPTAAGPFTYVETVVRPFAHNPTIRSLPNASGYVIFFIGDGTGSPVSCNTTTGEFVSQPRLTGGSIHAVYSPSLRGPWSAPVEIQFNDTSGAGAAWNGGGTNPSPLVHQDGTVTLALQRGFTANPGKELLGVARAATWRGPYTMVTAQPVRPERPGCIAGTGEDPFLWENSRGLHILYHGMCPTGVLEAHHAFSSDGGITWTLSPRQTYAYSARVNGKPQWFARVERPQLFFDPRNNEPAMLYNGVCDAGPFDQIYHCLELTPVPPSKQPVIVMTWTLARPLRKSRI